MFYHLIHGNVIDAARMHLAALIGLIYGAYVLIAWTASWLFGKPLRVWKPSKWVVGGYVVFFLVYSTVLRNLPYEPFTWFYIPDLTPAGR